MKNEETKFFTEKQKEFLKEKLLATFAILSENNYPILHPVLFYELEDKIYLTTYKNSKKVRKIVKNNKVGVSIISPKWYPYLSIYGEATIITREEEEKRFFEIIDYIATKYKEGQEKEEFIENVKKTPEYVLVEINPKQIYGNA